MGRIALALFLILFVASGAGAQNVPRSAVCTADNSETTSIAAVVAAPKAWMGRCVMVDGLYSNEQVHADVDAIYRLNGNSIGGFVDGLGPVRGALRGTFVGRVSDCAEAEETLLTAQLRAPGISLHNRVLGCLKPQGPFLMFMSTTGELAPSGLKRRLPGDRGGDLVLAPLDWPHLGAVTARANAFEKAMREGDEAALAGVLNNAYLAQTLLADDSSGLAFLKNGGGVPTVLMVRNAAEDEATAEACWCKQRACGKLWPIDSRDADNQTSRPYACLRVEGVRRDGMWKYRLDPSHDVNGLAEPK